jgi:hypothetical protein
MNQQSSSTKRLLVGLGFGAAFGLALGLILGLVFAYQVAPVQWTNAGPQDLRVDYAAYYWELVAESYAKHGDVEKARTQLGEWDDESVEEALERAYIESSPETQMYLDSLKSRAGYGDVEPVETVAAEETPVPEAEPMDEAGLGSVWVP